MQRLVNTLPLVARPTKEVVDILKKPAAERLKALRESSNPQAQFVWGIMRNAFHYAAVLLGEIAESARDIDFAMRWGFGSKQGPFEIWQEAGWKQVAEWVKADIDAGKALSKLLCQLGCSTAVTASTLLKVLGPPRKASTFRSVTCPSTSVSSSRENVLGANALTPRPLARPLFEDAAIRLWTLDDEVVIASIKSKMHTISAEVTAGLSKGLKSPKLATRAW